MKRAVLELDEQNVDFTLRRRWCRPVTISGHDLAYVRAGRLIETPKIRGLVARRRGSDASWDVSVIEDSRPVLERLSAPVLGLLLAALVSSIIVSGGFLWWTLQ